MKNINNLTDEEIEVMRKILFDTEYGYIETDEISDSDYEIARTLVDSDHLEMDLSVCGPGITVFSIYPSDECEKQLRQKFIK